MYEYIKREDILKILHAARYNCAYNREDLMSNGTLDVYKWLKTQIEKLPTADVVPRELYQRALSDVVTLSVERKKTDTTNCMCCYFCGAPLRWEADFSFADYGIDDQHGVVSDYSCDNCDTSYQIFKPFKSEESEDN